MFQALAKIQIAIVTFYGNASFAGCPTLLLVRAARDDWHPAARLPLRRGPSDDPHPGEEALGRRPGRPHRPVRQGGARDVRPLRAHRLSRLLRGQRQPVSLPQDAGGEPALPAGAGHDGGARVQEGAALRRDGGAVGQERVQDHSAGEGARAGAGDIPVLHDRIRDSAGFLFTCGRRPTGHRVIQIVVVVGGGEHILHISTGRARVWGLVYIQYIIAGHGPLEF